MVVDEVVVVVVVVFGRVASWIRDDLPLVEPEARLTLLKTVTCSLGE